MLDKVLVIGGSGFIGKRLMARHPEWSNIDLENGHDCRDMHSFQGFDAVVLLAAETGATLDDYAYNLSIYSGFVNALSCSQELPFIVYASSAAVYESTIGDHYEDELPDPKTLYGKSKFLGEQVIQDICNKYTILRFSNVYGDGDGHGAIDIFKRGDRVIYGDGEQVRDYIYVNKVVRAIERVIASPDKYSGQIFNISSGVGQTVNDVYEIYGRGEPEHAKPREFDVAHSVLDNMLAKEKGLL